AEHGYAAPERVAEARPPVAIAGEEVFHEVPELDVPRVAEAEAHADLVQQRWRRGLAREADGRVAVRELVEDDEGEQHHDGDHDRRPGQASSDVERHFCPYRLRPGGA